MWGCYKESKMEGLKEPKVLSRSSPSLVGQIPHPRVEEAGQMPITEFVLPSQQSWLSADTI